MKPIKQLVCLAGVAAGLFAATSGIASRNPTGTNSPSDTPEAATNSPAAPAAGATTNSPAVPSTSPATDAAAKTPQPAAEAVSTPGITVPQPAQEAPATNLPVAQVASVPATTSDTNSTAEFPANKGLRMNFRGAPLEMVLNYMSKAADFIINVSRGVDVKGKVDVWSEQPLTKEEAVDLLRKILNQNGYTVMQDKRILTIISSSQAKSNDGTPIEEANDFRTISKDTTVATEIIPVHSLNPVQLLKDLQPMLPPDTTIFANENANSLVMTDTHANIRHLAEIVATLDSVSSGVNTLQVFSLQYSDSKTVSDLIKELFPSTDAASRNNGGGSTRFGRFGGGGGMGMFGGFPGGGGGGGEGNSGQAPTTHIGAVADDHSNSVIVSAPEGMMNLISNVIAQIDVPIQAVTTIEVFKLKHADPVEMAELLGNLFPDENSTSDASRQPSQFGGRGGFFSAMLAATQGNKGGESSARMKLMGRVNAQPDPRTSSLVVTAATNLMPQIAMMIKKLDDDPARIVKPHLIALVNADPSDVLQILQDVVPPNPLIRTPANNTTQNNAMATRATSFQQQQNANQSTQSTGLNTAPGR